MPKEVIYGSVPAFPEGGPGVSIVEVRWSREGEHAQIVSKAVRREDHGRLADDVEGIHYTDGFYVDLDRKAINDLIRFLRRARDQAFGRDE
jgi:hypothetical protein